MAAPLADGRQVRVSRHVVVAISLVAACESSTKPPAAVDPSVLCARFLEMIVRERPADAPVLSRESLDVKRKECLAENGAWFAEQPEGYAFMAACAFERKTAIEWARCGFALRGRL